MREIRPSGSMRGGDGVPSTLHAPPFSILVGFGRDNDAPPALLVGYPGIWIPRGVAFHGALSTPALAGPRGMRRSRRTQEHVTG
jgi:hypothetical protein